jgi:hypothetical protein
MFKVEKIDIWTVEMDDKPGATTGLFRVLAEAGADLQFVLARRQPDKLGKGILFVSPIKGGKPEEAARRAGFSPRVDVVGVRVEGANEPGLGYKLTQALGAAGLNLRALLGNVIGKQGVVVIAFDNAADAEKGYQILRQLK